MVEKPQDPPSNLVSVGPMVLDKSIFAYEPDEHKSGELVLPSMVKKLAKDKPVTYHEAEFWFPVSHPEHIAEAEDVLSRRQK